MYLFPILTLTAAATIVGVDAAPFQFPTPDGFPNVTLATLAQIEHTAGGTVPNGPLPTSLKHAGITILQLLSNNELLEVALFTELLNNITNSVPGYEARDIAPFERQQVIKAFEAIVAVSRLQCFCGLAPN